MIGYFDRDVNGGSSILTRKFSTYLAYHFYLSFLDKTLKLGIKQEFLPCTIIIYVIIIRIFYICYTSFLIMKHNGILLNYEM